MSQQNSYDKEKVIWRKLLSLLKYDELRTIAYDLDIPFGHVEGGATVPSKVVGLLQWLEHHSRFDELKPAVFGNEDFAFLQPKYEQMMAFGSSKGEPDK